MDELPASFDVVIVGTGLAESLAAGACARAGKSVLHLDSNAYYGSRNATFNLQQLGGWLRGDAPEERTPASSPRSVVGQPDLPPAAPAARRILVAHVPDRPARVSYLGGDTPPDELLAQSHRYNIDLTPQLLLSAGPMVDVLRSSGVANYIEFKPMQAYLYGGSDAASQAAGLQRVPCGKADIFQSASIPLVQKRQLMKFLHSCLALQQEVDPDVHVPRSVLASPDAPPTALGDTRGSFADFAGRQKLAPALADLAYYAILQLPATVSASSPGPSASDGVRGVCRHLRSLGVYGPTAYLACFYGSSELPQAFCRLCAVWGGTYMLRTRGLAIELSEDGSVDAVVDADGRHIRTSHLVLNGDSKLEPYEPPAAAAAPASAAAAGAAVASAVAVSRCVVVLDAPLIAESGKELALATLFPTGAPGSTSVFVLQHDASAGACPQGKVLVHLSAQSQPGFSPQELLEPALHRLLSLAEPTAPPESAAPAPAAPPRFIDSPFPTKAEYDAWLASGAPPAGSGGEADEAPAPKAPTVLWGAFFELATRSCRPSAPIDGGELGSGGQLPSNLYAVDDSQLSVSCDGAVEAAKSIFEAVCGTETPFLPPAEEPVAEPPAGESGEGETPAAVAA